MLQGCCAFQLVGIHVNEVLQKSAFHLNESSQPPAQGQGRWPDFRLSDEGAGGGWRGLSCPEGKRENAVAQAMR